jgi:hypothetical protein
MSSAPLAFTCLASGGQRQRDVVARALVIAGWTGRDAAAVEHHIAELERLGVKRPKRVPIYYRVASQLLTQEDAIEVMGEDSSGEAEPVIVALDDGLWITVGSDHTDRKAETIGVTLSKQLCPKPIARALWRFDEIEAHWDKVMLRSFATDASGRRLYQEGPVGKIRPLRELIAGYAGASGLPAGTIMSCGTLAAIGGIKPAARFELELHDPVLNRTLRHAYAITSLPVEG